MILVNQVRKNQIKQKSNIHYTSVITPKRVTSGKTQPGISNLTRVQTSKMIFFDLNKFS